MDSNLNDLICRAAEKLGLKDTQIDTMRRRKDELQAQIASCQKELDGYIEEIGQHDAVLAGLKKKYEAASGGVKLLYGRKIKSEYLVRERVMEPANKVADRVDLYQLQSNKLDLLIFAIQHPAETERIQEITCDIKMYLDEEAVAKGATEELENTSQKSTTAKGTDEIMSVDVSAAEESDEMKKILAEI